jgi:hypothetical protein
VDVLSDDANGPRGETKRSDSPEGDGTRPHLWLAHLVGLGWVMAAAIAVLLPALARGRMLGSYDWLAEYGGGLPNSRG